MRCWRCGERELAAEVAVMAAVMQTNRGEQDVAWEQVGVGREADRRRHGLAVEGVRAAVAGALVLAGRQAGGGARVRRCRDRARGVARPRRHPRQRAQHEGDHLPWTGRSANPRGPAAKRRDRPRRELRGRDALSRQSRQQPARPRADRRGARDPRGGRGGGSALRKHVVPRLARTGTRRPTCTTTERGTRL